MYKYEIILWWSEEDKVYVGEVPDLPGCMAHGDTHEKALSSVKEAIAFWIETAKELNRLIPKPVSRKKVSAL
ncbi:MAG TPA: type II toxin-antitoxin system HicB family antitoxin [Spirochaetes bacterium]|nr:type II toxin-antitoxin system HicB family antitoxin [Spirochaetota bacterium]